MALSAGTSPGGDYLDLKALTADGPIVCVFVNREFADPEPGDYGYPKVPVYADVLICDGPEVGTIYRNERIFGNPTSSLRGVKNPTQKNPEVLPPTRKIDGQPLVYRVETIEQRGKAPFVGLQVPSPADLQRANQIWQGTALQKEADGEQSAPQSDPEPVSAGAGPARKPFG